MGFPVLALNQGGPAILAQDEVDAAVRCCAASLLHCVALAAERFADKQFEVLPVHDTDRVEPGLSVEQPFAMKLLERGNCRRK